MHGVVSGEKSSRTFPKKPEGTYLEIGNANPMDMFLKVVVACIQPIGGNGNIPCWLFGIGVFIIGYHLLPIATTFQASTTCFFTWDKALLQLMA